ncbi:hypothetical protein PF007_g20451 [Phytophthora fragariae]|uniref:WLGC domain-containing protein n=1 Tax=Phytophthora fragariae TaxID=53985 RepID=A0A6A3R5N3_9STRA|nr:hypothetical protein PF003_g6245 [Phytophthora fragariae]KAE9087240.1 hypothetical protein PF007_g20451 [Phytophthora fragariae]
MMELPDWFKEFTKLEYLHIEGIPENSLESLSDDLFNNMPSLTFIHLAGHPSLPVLPSFDGLTGLKSLTLAVLLSLTELPSFAYLDSRERLQLSSMAGLVRLPDLTPVSGTLKSFVVSDRGTWCCNGFLGTCNLQDPLCDEHPVFRTPVASCLTGDTATAGTMALVKKFSNDVCREVLQAGTLETSPTESGMAQCNGTLYRECHDAGYPEAMCYSARFMGIACTSNPYPIAMRRRQISEGVGIPCDPRYEAWLGCI